MYSTASNPSSGLVLINDTMYTVDNLNEYTEYVFHISAATSAGLGPYAETSDQTTEDGLYV